MARTIRLLLTENVDNLGIVGDVVNVRPGYARNFLLPRELAEQPSDDKVKALATKRAEAEKLLAALRSEREKIIAKLTGLQITMVRACNDQGQLYGSVSQNDIADGLTELGFPVKAREVRLPQTIKRLGTFEVHVKFDRDLEATVGIHVEADRTMQADDREEMEFDNEGELIEKPSKKPARPDRSSRRAEQAEADAIAASQA